jgi:hypothetical protein
VVSRARSIRLVLGVAAAIAGGCDTDFEDPSIVLDLRILGMRAEPPEIVAPVDPADPTDIDLADIPPVRVCALVAEPNRNRGAHYQMRLCPPTGGGRCTGSDEGEEEQLVVELAAGDVDDPDTLGPGDMCATVEANADLVVVVQQSVRADDLAGFGGIGVQVDLAVTPDGGDEQDTVWGFKRVRYSPQLPEERVANLNPALDGITGARDPTGERDRDFEIPLGRCGSIDPFLVAPGERVTMLPRETEGAREDYVLPTFEGGARSYTENLRYQWHATAGEWSRFETGGELDPVGNQPPLDTRWTAPDDSEEIGEGLDVAMWIVQRDERGGQAWYETCARVVP